VFSGTELRLMFPWHLIISGDQIIPLVHPNCRCTLLRVSDISDYLSLTSPPSAWFNYTQDLEALQICR
jgi:hypothetical protein